MSRLLSNKVLSTGCRSRINLLFQFQPGFKSEFQLCSHLLKPCFTTNPIRLYHHSQRLLETDKKHNISTSERLRLTKTKFLSQASGPLSRLVVRVKWLLQRNNKPFSIDDISAMFSWLVMGNVLWIILGTTTFGLVLLYSLHTFDQVSNQISTYIFGNEKNDNDKEEPKRSKDDGIVAYLTSAILSNGLGIKIEFQKKSVLPEFKDGKLIFRNLNILSVNDDSKSLSFDCNVQSLKLSLSFGKWSDGNGLIQDLEISGLTGKIFKFSKHKTQDISNMESGNPIVFRRYLDSVHFQFDMNDQTDEVAEEPKKLTKMDANYELSSVKIRDSFLEIYDSAEVTEPLRISLFNCEFPKISGRSLLVDFFNADNVTGSINESMFTIHKRQDYDSENKTIRFKLDGIDMGNLAQRNPRLKFNWILNGKAEVVADIRFPSSPDDNSKFMLEYRAISDMFSKLLYDIGAINTSTTKTTHDNNNDNNEEQLMKGALHAMYETFEKQNSNNQNLIHSNETTDEYVFITAKVKFSQLQATLPKCIPSATTGNIPFITLHDLRSLVSYINKLDTDDRPPIVVNTMVIEKLSELYNIDHLTEARVFDIIVSDIYDEFLKMVKLDEQRIINGRSSMWSHSLASQLLLLGLGVIV